MYYAFEIRNDMSHSVNVFKRLDTDFLRQNGPIPLNWCSPGAFTKGQERTCQLDFTSVNKFGSCKIREAQIVKDFDQAIL
jgi:hypothetical protein